MWFAIPWSLVSEEEEGDDDCDVEEEGEEEVVRCPAIFSTVLFRNTVRPSIAIRSEPVSPFTETTQLAVCCCGAVRDVQSLRACVPVPVLAGLGWAPLGWMGGLTLKQNS